jgi:hypothetical protein
MTPREAVDTLARFINHPSTGDDNEADAIEAVGVLDKLVVDAEEAPMLAKPAEPWLDNSIQFPRLLSEIFFMGLTPEQERHLEAEMDLEGDSIRELFERADAIWQEIKDRTRPANADNPGCSCGMADHGAPGHDSHISAEAHSDNHASEVRFNAAPFFEQASDEEILALAKCDWGGDYPADRVAEFMADGCADLRDMFRYVEAAHKVKDMGFECHVDEDDAMRWLDQNWPELAAKIREEVNE